MAALKFAETHNLVAFLEKPDEMKTVNGEVQLQALVDGKKVIITKTSVRRDLHLEDAEGTECLPTATIFEELTRMGYEKLTQKLTFYKAFFSPQWKFLIHTILQCLSAKTTAWNEFSSTMASAIICLATNQKFNFSKYIFDNMVKNLEGGVKFLMYPRFVQVFVNQQLGDMSHHKKIFVTPSHTKKVFGNMKREGKGFSGRVTPLFQTMMVQAHEEVGEGSEIPFDPQHTPIINQSSTSQPQKRQPRRKQRKDTEVPQPNSPTEPIAEETQNKESVPTHSNDLLLSGEDSIKLNKLMELCTTLQSKVLALETTKTNQAHEITSLKKRVKKLERRKKSRTQRLKRLYKVGLSARIDSSNDKASLGDPKDASKQERKIQDIDADEDIILENVNDVDMFGVNDLDGDKVFVENVDASAGEKVEQREKVVESDVAKEVVSTAGDVAPVSAATVTTVELTLAQTLAELKSAIPKAKGPVIPEQEPSDVSRVHQNPPHESHYLNTYLSETINLQTQQRDAHREGLRSIGQALKNMTGGKRK
ncbi:hypothetical protein Tco_1174756 [Tanacetum coccineum]